MSAGNLKAILFLIGAPFLSWMLIQRGCEEMARRPEAAPTTVRADDFARAYRGESWLTVDGKWAADHAWVAGAPESKDNDRVNVFVPVVPADWKPADAVHVVAVFSAPDMAAARAWPAEHGGDQRRQVTGSVAPRGVWNYKKMFPDLAVTEPIVFLYEGQLPAGHGDGAFDFWFGVAIAVAAALLVLVPYLRHRRDVRRQGPAAGGP